MLVNNIKLTILSFENLGDLMEFVQDLATEHDYILHDEGDTNTFISENTNYILYKLI